MAKNVLLLVDYGVNNSIHIGLFKIRLKEAGWRPGLVEGAFEKNLDLPDSVIETTVQEEVDNAANQAAFKKTCCELFVTEDELKFCWDWNTP
ncbi:hypothetical protein KP004_13400 [Geomonas oryzisoli]|uniref:Uncharacterized protein n=1 Tax=Geomonas oryzisoli TaxID=2847992 RepID=A0ABX8J5F1_9BACT|nr:hypothetical protein [Geomonas oryzisoli]QWV92212.1 hypothetical protein KP004_13400 [Geomonas oryzisoli]